MLVVDDDPEIRAFLSRVLTAKGHTVEPLETGFSVGLRLASRQEQAVDAIVLDFMMPGLSGVSVLKQLASSERGARTPVLLYSAAPIEDLPDGALDVHQHTRFLQKGARIQQVVAEIESLFAMGAGSSP